jgi:Zn finger protein HypA/HybF involved in hydrogenase expression
MHESHLLETIFKYLDKEERESSKRIRKVYISLSEFGGISEEHFKKHYREGAAGTKWENLQVQIAKIPYGPELEITRLDFE